MIDATARIADGAVIGRDVVIGPNCVVGPNVVIGDHCQLLAHVHVAGHTSLGARTIIHPFASVGSPPQSLKYRGGATRLIVGTDCVIREAVTLNTGTEDDRGVTEVGDRCLLMAGAHVAHDCKLGSNVILANNVALGGHVTIEDFAVLGGQSAVRQFVRIGEGAMAAGLSGVRADVIPFGLVQGPLADLIGLNIIGLRRRGSAKAAIHGLRRAYRELFFGTATFRERLQAVATQFDNHELVGKVVAFIRSGGSRPLTMAVRRTDASRGE
jgi:UDP-N-acetylglucosamine acyltransferase